MYGAALNPQIYILSDLHLFSGFTNSQPNQPWQKRFDAVGEAYHPKSDIGKVKSTHLGLQDVISVEIAKSYR